MFVIQYVYYFEKGKKIKFFDHYFENNRWKNR